VGNERNEGAHFDVVQLLLELCGLGLGRFDSLPVFLGPRPRLLVVIDLRVKSRKTFSLKIPTKVKKIKEK
jgi:hypothetical protein